MAKSVAKTSGAAKGKKSPATTKRPPLTEVQLEMRRARERRARCVAPDLKEQMLSVLETYKCERISQTVSTGTIVSYIPPRKKATFIAKGRLGAVTPQVGRKGEFWATIAPIRGKDNVSVDLCDVYTSLPGKGHYQLSSPDTQYEL